MPYVFQAGQVELHFANSSLGEKIILTSSWHADLMEVLYYRIDENEMHTCRNSTYAEEETVDLDKRVAEALSTHDVVKAGLDKECTWQCMFCDYPSKNMNNDACFISER